MFLFSSDFFSLLKMPLAPNSAKKPPFDAFAIETQLKKHYLHFLL